MDKNIVPEILQGKANVNNITREIEKILYDEEYRQNYISQLGEVKSKLSDKYSAQEAAKVIAEEFNK